MPIGKTYSLSIGATGAGKKQGVVKFPPKCKSNALLFAAPLTYKWYQNGIWLSNLSTKADTLTTG
jgi:hypothetical protein